MSAWLLILFLGASNGWPSHTWHEIPTGMEACWQTVANAKTDIAKGGDAESAVLLICLPAREYEIELRDTTSSASPARKRRQAP